MPTLAEILAKKAANTAETQPAFSGIKITPDSEKVALAASIKESLDTCAPKVKPLAPRELGAMTPGERIPMDHPKEGAPRSEWEWFDSMHSFKSEMGIVMEPEGDHAWVAVQAFQNKPPILLYRLPLINRKSKEADPF